MKKYLIIYCIAIFAIVSCQKESPSIVEKKIWVRGNCDMCKERIETQITAIKGVKSAVWNVDTKELTVKFDSLNTQLSQIEKMVASSGHATKNTASTEKSINELPECCKPE
jgi:periplasmic mercuric ion binding protein